MSETKPRNAELIVLLALLTAIGPFSIDTYLPGMPGIAADFGVAKALVQQSLSAYFLGLAAGQLIFGPFSDRFGRRPILLVGLVIYLVATVASTLAPTIGVLILGRALQGLGASALPAAGRAVIRDVWAGDEAARALSFVIMVMSFAPLIAPIIGGQLYVWLGWQSIFWFMAGFGALLLVLVQLRLPETNGPERRGNVAISSYFRAYGQVMTNAHAWGYLLTGGLSLAMMFAYITSASFVYITYFDVDPQWFGLFFGVNVIALLLGNWINSRQVIRFGYLRLLGAGLMVSLIGALFLLVCTLTHTGGIVTIMIGLFIAVAPVAMTSANAIAGMLNAYPDNAGAASALFGLFQYGMGAFSGVLVGALFTGTPLAMTLAMTLMASGAFLSWLWLAFMQKRTRSTTDRA